VDLYIFSSISILSEEKQEKKKRKKKKKKKKMQHWVIFFLFFFFKNKIKPVEKFFFPSKKDMQDQLYKNTDFLHVASQLFSLFDKVGIPREEEQHFNRCDCIFSEDPSEFGLVNENIGNKKIKTREEKDDLNNVFLKKQREDQIKKRIIEWMKTTVDKNLNCVFTSTEIQFVKSNIIEKWNTLFFPKTFHPILVHEKNVFECYVSQMYSMLYELNSLSIFMDFIYMKAQTIEKNKLPSLVFRCFPKEIIANDFYSSEILQSILDDNKKLYQSLVKVWTEERMIIFEEILSYMIIYAMSVESLYICKKKIEGKMLEKYNYHIKVIKSKIDYLESFMNEDEIKLDKKLTHLSKLSNPSNESSSSLADVLFGGEDEENKKKFKLELPSFTKRPWFEVYLERIASWSFNKNKTIQLDSFWKYKKGGDCVHVCDSVDEKTKWDVNIEIALSLVFKNKI
jgi:hypothetical protein